VVDSGVVPILTTPITTRLACPPKLLVFDLATDDLLMKYVFPYSDFGPDSLFDAIAVDIRGGRCEEAFAYIPDTLEFALIVFDSRNRKSWKVKHDYFYPFPTHGVATLDGDSADQMDGIFTVALSPLMRNGYVLIGFKEVQDYAVGHS